MSQTSKVKIKVKDQSEMQVFIARPEHLPQKAPVLLVLQEAFGVNQHIREVAVRFSGEGFVTIAPELFHRTAPFGFEGSYSDFNSVLPHLKAVTEETLRADFEAIFDFVSQDSQMDSTKISAIGYCMGGRAAFVANSVLKLKSAVSYYGGGIFPELRHLAAHQSAPLLLVWGGLDKHIGLENPRKLTDELTSLQKKFVDVVFSDADHGFFCDARPVYNKIASDQAWALTVPFLKTYP